MSTTGSSAFHAGGGDMGAKVRAFDWSATPLGPMAGWTSALRITVDQMLASKFPACLFWGPDFIAIYNDGYRVMLGDKPEALGQPMRVTWAEVWLQLQPIAEKALHGESTFIEDFMIRVDRRGQLEDAYFTFNYGPVFDEHGAVVGILDTVVETTAKVLSEQRSRDDEIRLRQLNAELERRVIERTLAVGRTWRISPDLLSVIDAQGHFEATNPAWEKVLGWTEAQLAGTDFRPLVHPDDRGATLAAWTEASEHGRPVPHFENRYRDAQGGWHWLSWMAIPEDGKVYCITRDVTKEKADAAVLAEAQEALRQAQKMEAVGQLTGGIAHDFNNLLAAIGGSLQAVQKRLGQGKADGLDRYLDMAGHSVRSAAALTQRLLAFSRQQTLDPKAIDVNRLVSGMADLIARTMGPAIRVDVRPAPTPWAVLVDAPQLENALLNLCINARDAMPSGGQLTIAIENVSTGTAVEQVCLSVTDTGTGMAPEVVQRIFEPFFTTKPQGQGTGLGLSMVYGFVRQSGGEVRVDTEPGRGTTVSLWLPRHDGALAAEAATAEPPAATEGGGATVLLIEDEPTVREILHDELQDAGYTVVVAEDGPSGLRQLQRGTRVDLLVTDVGLPGGLNGREVADAGRALHPGLKVLFITGYAESAAVGNGRMEAGMEAMTKPFEVERLLARVRRMLDTP